MLFLRNLLFPFFLLCNTLVIAYQPENDHIEPRLSRIEFSHEAGFYSSIFQLRLRTPDNQPLFKYTIDGSEPATSTTAKLVSDSVSITINPDNIGGRGKTPAFIIRAASVNAKGECDVSITKTYIFPHKVKEQQNPGNPWPGLYVNGQRLDYEMATDVTTKPPYSFQMNDALMQIPSISLVSDMQHLFNVNSGIYVNAEKKGRDWERPCSIELIYPDGSEGFQINAGMRIRGGNSAKNKNNPKRAFKFYFRGQYGYTKLNYPLFDDEGTDSYDRIDLRCENNYSWSMDGSTHNTMIKDIFSRDLQREIGQPYKRGRQYHLYLNGMYWGIYQTDERAEANYAESYFGGNDDDYDVVKADTQPWPYIVEATDGNLDSWKELWNLCKKGFYSNQDYFNLEGKNAIGERVPEKKVMTDIDNLIDYMLIIFYTGNFDAPVSGWYGNRMPNNFYAIFSRNDVNLGYRFLVHDSEHSLFVDRVYGFNGINENRVKLGSTGSMVINDMHSFNPQWLHHKLTANSEYKLRFADKAYRHLTNNGALTPESTELLFRKRVEEIDMAIIAESARWGDAQKSSSLTKTNNWLPEIDKLYNSYFPQRTDIVISQLRNEGLWPSGESPQIFAEAANVTNQKTDFTDTLYIRFQTEGNEGTIFYTTNGTDPRNIGGSINPDAISTAIDYNVLLKYTSHVNARIKYSNGWGPLATATFRNLNNNFDNFRITEINYNPEHIIRNDVIILSDELEFLEFKNIGNSLIDLTGLSIDSGVHYQFPDNVLLMPGEHFVTASKPKKFFYKYGFYPQGNYKKRLLNAGELIHLADALGNTVLSFEYNSQYPWPEEANGQGYSLVTVNPNPNGNPSDYSYWRASNYKGGSPGTDDETANHVSFDTIAPTPKIYPNPSNGIITLEIDNDKNDIGFALFDHAGNIVLKSKMKNGEKINLLNYKIRNGIYIAQITVDETIYHQKLTIIN